MSTLTDFLHGIAGFFSNNQSTTEAAEPAMAGLTAAAQAAEAALPPIAEAGANAALQLLGPAGTALAPLADEFIDQVIAKLTAKKSTAAVPTVAPAAATPLAPSANAG